jgi:hypothetical protein
MATTAIYLNLGQQGIGVIYLCRDRHAISQHRQTRTPKDSARGYRELKAKTNSNPLEQLDALYTHILESTAFGTMDYHHPPARRFCRLVICFQYEHALANGPRE